MVALITRSFLAKKVRERRCGRLSGRIASAARLCQAWQVEVTGRNAPWQRGILA
jgi:hypothetical protein